MKNLSRLLFATMFLLTISACEKRSCSKVVCPSYQTCTDGLCLCPNGFEGDSCTTLSTTKYLGTWTVLENCPLGPSGLPTYYSVNMTLDPSYQFNYIAITPLLESGTIYAEIINQSPSTEGTTIFVPAQNSQSGAIQIAASYGTYYPPSVPGGKPEISLTLNYTYQGVNNQCIETFHKN
jgi:hypothetical protein